MIGRADCVLSLDTQVTLNVSNKFSGVMLELAFSHALPLVSGGFKELLHFSLSSFVTILQELSKLSIDLSISLNDDLDIKVVHDI